MAKAMAKDLTSSRDGVRILYLSPYYWPEEIGSASYSTDLAVWLKDHGHQVRVVAFRPHYPNPDQFTAWADGSRDEETHLEMPISRVAVASRGSGGFKDRVKNDLKYLWFVVRRALRGDYRNTDVVVAYIPSVLTVYGAILVRLRTGARIVGVIHDLESGLASSLGMANNGALLKVMQFVERFAFNRAQEIVVMTDGMRQEVQSLGCKRPITILSIWAEPAPFAPVNTAAPPTLLYSGNFGKKQNLDQLFPLIERLNHERPDIQVVFRGDGSEKPRLQQKAAELGLKNTTFLPLVPAEEFVATLQAANVHLVPQALNVANYALPSKLFSIMSAGRPYVCIAEAHSPLDVLAEQSSAGRCIQPGDEAGLFDAVTGLIDDVALQGKLGEAGRQFVLQEMNRAKILSVYEALITGNASREISPSVATPQ